MIIDSRKISENQVVESDICIIGSGPAGITLARSLAGLSSHVCLLESGGIEQDEAIQDLSDGPTFGDDFLPIKGTRNRQVGGNSNIWSIKLHRKADRDWEIGVRYAPFDDVDFEQRDWVPHSGWPIGRKDLDPYYEKAQKFAHSGPYAYDAEAWSNEQTKPVDFDDSLFVSRVYQFEFV